MAQAMNRRAVGGDLPVLDDGDACRVVPSIFQILETMEDDGGGLTGPHVSDDAAHTTPISFGCWLTGVYCQPLYAARFSTFQLCSVYLPE